MSNVGRKAKYDNELLTNKLYEYIDLNPNTPIKFSKLEKFSGIPRHIWRDNPKLSQIIKKVNTPEIIINTQNMILELPSTEDILSHYNNKKKLEKTLNDLLHFTTTLYDKAIKYDTFEKIELDYQLKIKELTVSYENKLKKANDEIVNLNNEIDSLYLDSRNSLTRKQKGIKNNMIELSEYNQDSLSKRNEDLKKQFSSLFK